MAYKDLEQRAKKCIELRGEYVEWIPSLVAVACFLAGRAKNLSAPPHIHVSRVMSHNSEDFVKRSPCDLDRRVSLSYIRKLWVRNKVQTGPSTLKKNYDQEAVTERYTVDKEAISVKQSSEYANGRNHLRDQRG